jgi:adenine-specific DNA-methyltransferase
MAKKYTGSLSLEWFNKQKSIINLDENSIKSEKDIPAPKINWINKEEALFYEISMEEGIGNTPYWVNRDDIRVKEARPLVFQKGFKAIKKDKKGTIQGTYSEFVIEEIEKEEDAKGIKNILIKGDNLLALNTLKKHFDKLPDSEKVKCIYIDPPYNTGSAFEHYDDNLELSEWLTLVRDRLQLLRELLKEEGVIFISIDKNVFHLKLLLDEIFGSENFCGNFTWEKKKKPAFLSKMGTLTESILVYAKDKSLAPDFIYGLTTEGKKYPVNNAGNGVNEIQFPPKSVRFRTKDGVVKAQDMSEGNIITELLEDLIIQDYYNLNTLKLKGEWRYSQNTIDEIIKNGDEIYIAQIPFRPNHIKKGGDPKKIHNLLTINHYKVETYEDSAKHSISLFGEENAFDYPKPEKLIHILLSTVCMEGDLVLDIFGGSGTTFATAHKMGLQWIGVEIGNHMDKNIIPRMLKVLSNKDKGGITNEVNWEGGGSFAYYHLGRSIINIDKETGKGEFNWELGKSFIQDSLLLSYDFTVDGQIAIMDAKIFDINNKQQPSVGRLVGRGGSAIYGIAYLASPDDKDLSITNDEVKLLYNGLKKNTDFKSLIIYTNKGIDLAEDSIPDDLEIVKVPHAIFAELER